MTIFEMHILHRSNPRSLYKGGHFLKNQVKKTRGLFKSGPDLRILQWSIS